LTFVLHSSRDRTTAVFSSPPFVDIQLAAAKGLTSLADLIDLAEVLLVLGIFAGRVIRARGRTWATAASILMFVALFAGLFAFAQSPARMEKLFGPTRWLEVRLQCLVNLAIFVLAMYGWRIEPRRIWRLVPLAAVVAIVCSGEVFSIFVLMATGKSWANQFDAETATTLGWREWVFLGLASAFLAGVGELIARAVLQLLLGPNTANLFTTLPSLRRQDLWLVPAADAVLFLPLALGLGTLQRRWPWLISWPGAAYTFACLSLSWPLLALSRETTYPLARLVLLLGIAHSLVPAIAHRWIDRPTWIRATNRLLVAGWSAACLAMLIWTPRDVAHDTSGTPGRSTRPNVVLITLDTVRAQSLGLYGYERATTPELVKWAKHGVVFERAMAPSSWTLPTHASLFSGQLPHRHGADFLSPIRGDIPLLAEQFTAVGYRTVGFVANSASCGAHTGLARGFEQYDEHPPLAKEFWRLSALGKSSFCRGLPFLRTTAAELNDKFLGWLDHHPNQPFFAFLNYYDAHEPYDVPDARFDRFTQTSAEARYVARQRWQRIASAVAWDPLLGTDDQLQLALDTYESSIAYLDYHLGRLLEELQRRGILDNTLVVITSDHGEHFGERGLRSHAVSLYRQLIQVPLVVLFENRVPAERRVSDPVGLVDLPATILELAGLSPSGMPGRSLAAQWDARETAKGDRSLVAELSQIATVSDLPNSRGPIQSIVHGDWHYLRYPGQQKEELFDLIGDPLEKTNLTETGAARAELLADLKRRLDAALALRPPVADPGSLGLAHPSATFVETPSVGPCLCGRRHDDLLRGHALGAAVDRLASRLIAKRRRSMNSAPP